MTAGLLLTDTYELRMAASYLRRHMFGLATFSLFVRRLPPSRGFLVAAGLEDCVAFLDTFGAGGDDEGYLTEIAGLTKADAHALAGVHFTGEVLAVPEGTVVFENEPLIEVTAPIAEAQLVETYLLNQITFQTAIASKAARCRIAAKGRPLVEFGFRRTHGVEAGLAAARVSAIAGFAATSNVAAAQRYGLATSGTMAHSYIEAFESEANALSSFAEDFPLDPTFLIDTYDPRSGVDAAVLAAREHGVGERFSVRLDSGDLDAVTRAIRRQLDDAGCPHARIFVSGGLDEYEIARLLRSGAPIDAFGVGTKLGVSADAPTLDTAYKLVAYDGRPLMKLSAGKSTLPAAKQVFRNFDIGGDILGLREERFAGRHPLLQPVMRAGRRLAPPETIDAMAARLTREIWSLPGSALTIDHPNRPGVMVSSRLRRLRKECAARLIGARSAPLDAPPEMASSEAQADARVLAYTTQVRLRDGARIRIRPIVHGDAEAILRGFKELSRESRRHRFFNPPSTLSEAMLRSLTTVDSMNHVALGAFDLDTPGQPGVAIARYVRLADDPTCAEAAVTVREGFRRRGIATILLETLAIIALQSDIRRFSGFVQWDNDEALQLVRKLGGDVRHDSPGVARYDVALRIAESALDEQPLHTKLRLFAKRAQTLAAGVQAPDARAGSVSTVTDQLSDSGLTARSGCCA